MSEQTAQDKLAAPFAVTHKKNGMDYLTGEQVTSRLNEVLGWNGWSFRVLEHGYNEQADEIWCLSELTVWQDSTPIVRQQLGSQKPNRRSTTKEILDLGFDLKGAATDALKKCASLIGVGLYLHEKDAGTQNAAPAKSAAPASRQTPPPAPLKVEATKPTFWETMTSNGFTQEQVSKRSLEMFKREPDDLSLKEKNQLYIDMTAKKLEKASA